MCVRALICVSVHTCLLTVYMCGCVSESVYLRVCPGVHVCVHVHPRVRVLVCARMWVRGLPQLCLQYCFLTHVWHFFAAELGGSGLGGRLGSGGGVVYASRPPRLHILVVVSLAW